MTVCEPGQAFAFAVGPGTTVVNTWRYALVPALGGTDVTESFALAKTPLLRLYWFLLHGESE